MNKLMFDENVKILMVECQTVLLLDDIKNMVGTVKNHFTGICILITLAIY